MECFACMTAFFGTYKRKQVGLFKDCILDSLTFGVRCLTIFFSSAAGYLRGVLIEWHAEHAKQANAVGELKNSTKCAMR